MVGVCPPPPPHLPCDNLDRRPAGAKGCIEEKKKEAGFTSVDRRDAHAFAAEKSTSSFKPEARESAERQPGRKTREPNLRANASLGAGAGCAYYNIVLYCTVRGGRCTQLWLRLQPRWDIGRRRVAWWIFRLDTYQDAPVFHVCCFYVQRRDR